MSKTLKSIISNKRRSQIVQYLSSHRHQKPVSSLLQIADYIVKGGENVSYNSLTNGENEVVKILSKNQLLNTIIDCGANTGTNTRVFKKYNPNATVYCIEAIDDTLEKCKDFTKDLSDIHYHNMGMGNEEKRVTFKYFPNNIYLSTKYENVTGRELEVQEKIVQITTGDNFMMQENIPHVNFLKIDVEGMDFEVIQGFKNAIAAGKIDVIQFEYCANFIYSKVFLKDIYDFFPSEKYVIGKIFPNGVDFIPYSTILEDFLDANYLIIKKDKTSLIQDLQKF